MGLLVGVAESRLAQRGSVDDDTASFAAKSVRGWQRSMGKVVLPKLVDETRFYAFRYRHLLEGNLQIGTNEHRLFSLHYFKSLHYSKVKL